MRARDIVLDAEATYVAPASLVDMSRYRNDGVFTDITMAQLPSGLQVYGLNGTTSFIDCGTNNSLLNIGSGDFTVITWVNYSASTNDNSSAIGIFTDAGGRWWRIGLESGEFRFSVDDNINRRDSAIGVGTINLKDDSWHMLTGVKIYNSSIIGNIDAYTYTGNDDGASVDSSNTDQYTSVGAQKSGQLPMTGYVALPQIYNYALSAGEILTRYNQTVGFFEAQ